MAFDIANHNPKLERGGATHLADEDFARVDRWQYKHDAPASEYAQPTHSLALRAFIGHAKNYDASGYF